MTAVNVVRAAASPREDLEHWRRSASGNKLVFPGHDGEPWSLAGQGIALVAGQGRLSAAPLGQQTALRRRCSS